MSPILYLVYVGIYFFCTFVAMTIYNICGVISVAIVLVVFIFTER